MRFALMALVASLFPIVANVQTVNPANRSDAAPKIELKLIPEKVAIRQGETLKVRVEIWNVGTDDVIIAQNIGATFGNSELRLFLETDSMREGQPGMLGDSIPESNPDFEKTFVTNWLTLNRAHFYGTYVYTDPIDYPHLRRPGQHRVRAEYCSRGISSTSGWNGGFLKQEDVDKLPFTALKGTINSNVVRIQVGPRKKTSEK